MNRLICILGASCCGKDTVRSMLVERHPELVEATSHTTRPMRANETGNEYYFIDETVFHAMYDNGEFIETRVYEVIGDNDSLEYWYYGYTVEEIDSKLRRGNIIMIVDLKGFKEFKSIYGDRCIGFYLNVDRDLRVQRYLSRDELNYKVVKECIRRIDDDDNVAFKGYRDWVDYIIDTNNSEYSTKVIEQYLNL